MSGIHPDSLGNIAKGRIRSSPPPLCKREITPLNEYLVEYREEIKPPRDKIIIQVLISGRL